MTTEKEIVIIQKATVYDLKRILEGVYIYHTFIGNAALRFAIMRT